jgi:3-isopropylmalate/(R)-2-methylmalate dehydratase small subunit
MQPLHTITSRFIPLPSNNIDTDQIIPARYLKVTDKSGLGEGLFYGWRYLPDGSLDLEFPLNRPEYQGAEILVAGDNFGCGSSREHAPWALTSWGVRAVVSTSFADIFRNNALKNGLMPVVVDADTQGQLFELARADPAAQLHIDLDTQTLTLPDGKRVIFPIDAFNKTCLLEGLDQLGYLLRFEDQIIAYERSNHYKALYQGKRP